MMNGLFTAAERYLRRCKWWDIALGASIGALLYAVARQGITLAGWDPPWFQALLGVLLVVALVANGVVGHRLKGVPRS